MEVLQKHLEKIGYTVEIKMDKEHNLYALSTKTEDEAGPKNDACKL